MLFFFNPARKEEKPFYNNNRLLNKHLAFEYLNTILNHCLKYSDANSADFSRSTCMYTLGYTKEGKKVSLTLATIYRNYSCKCLPRINKNRHFQRQATLTQDLKLQGINPNISNSRLRNSEQNGRRYKQQEENGVRKDSSNSGNVGS